MHIPANHGEVLKEHNDALSVNRLLVAVIQEQDAEIVAELLLRGKFNFFRLPSTGGFLGQRSVTLLVGLHQNQVEDLAQVIRQTCRPRVEYVTLPIEGSPIPMPSPTPITVGGATMFSIDVERYEAF